MGLITSYLAVLGGGLTTREQLFVAFAWLPKATVQAAIGPLALDKAKEALASSGFNCSQQLLSDLRSNNETMENINPLSPSENGDIGDMVELCKMVEYGEKVLTIAVGHSHHCSDRCYRDYDVRAKIAQPDGGKESE